MTLGSWKDDNNGAKTSQQEEETAFMGYPCLIKVILN